MTIRFYDIKRMEQNGELLEKNIYIWVAEHGNLLLTVTMQGETQKTNAKGKSKK